MDFRDLIGSWLSKYSLVFFVDGGRQVKCR